MGRRQSFASLFSVNSVSLELLSPIRIIPLRNQLRRRSDQEEGGKKQAYYYLTVTIEDERHANGNQFYLCYDFLQYLLLCWLGGFVVVYSTLSPLSQSQVVELLYLQVLDLHPNLRDEIVPVGFISAMTILTWLVIAVVFRVLHRSQGPALLVCGTKLWGRVAYRTSFLAALERPVMVLITIFALLMIVFRVEPALIKLRYTGPSWVGAYFVSVIWFLERWKRNVLARALEMRSISVAERENLLTFNKASARFLFFKGLVMLADSFKLVVPLWFAVVSMTMTIAVLGLVVLYYRNCPRISVMPSERNGLNLGPSIAAKDVVRNVISGAKLLMLQQRFEVGNMIRVDDVDGQVVSSGLATTCILMADTAPITVPNSVLLELLYLNRVTRQHPPIDRWDAMVTNIPLRTFDINMIDLTSLEIERMLETSPKVFLEEPPFCFFSRTERSVNLTVGCSLREMSQTEFKYTKKEFLIRSIEIITRHGATLACTLEDVLSL